ncbi:uncharacterized protein EI97DRAFT_161026 [Westerdykella ornata]|uniref:Uncharacterized protein n=1 Tax=Westerdykella ornata TaxID=318751 RepID=A0A6A6JAQ6_WESOR|nr:uncharacterized protein EI97DRAFT_161026 [Westerdykella ornata]KAF2273314.1 hypothetical protein EI97DRAFT_161026 [Westerdykella ornata]
MSAPNRTSTSLAIPKPSPTRKTQSPSPRRATKLQKKRYYSHALSDADRRALAAGVENHSQKHWSEEDIKRFQQDRLGLIPTDRKEPHEHESEDVEQQAARKDTVCSSRWLRCRNRSMPLTQGMSADDIQSRGFAQNSGAASTLVLPLVMTPRASMSLESSSGETLPGQASAAATTMSSQPLCRRRRFSFESDYDELVDGEEAWAKLRANPVEVVEEPFDGPSSLSATCF